MDPTPAWNLPPRHWAVRLLLRHPIVAGGLMTAVGLGLVASYITWGRATTDEKSLGAFLIAVGFLLVKGTGGYLIIAGAGLPVFISCWRRRTI